MTSIARLFGCAFIPLLLLTACDSGDPASHEIPEDVIGVYSFTVLSFQPDASVLPTLNLLDTLSAEDTRLQLFDGRDFVFTYRYREGRIYGVFGRFSATSAEVRLERTGGGGERQALSELLFTGNLSLRRDAGNPKLLTAELRRTVDMGALSNRYTGIPPVTGTLRIRMHE
jgi:hypothetical protein